MDSRAKVCENKEVGVVGATPNQATAYGSDDMATSTSKRTTSPAFQFYPKDFLASSKVDDMSMTERGVYITLLSRCWLDNGLPTDLPALAKYARMKPANFERMWSTGPLRECFVERGGRFHNDRLDHERKSQAEYRKRQQARADQRWHPKDADAAALQAPHAGPARSGTALQSSSSSASSSASTPDGVARPSARPAPIIQRRRKDAAFEWGRLYVPQRVHDDLVMLGNHGTDEAALFAWYQAVCEDYAAHPDWRIDADLFRFWKAKYADKWPPPVAAKADARLPEWAR